MKISMKLLTKFGVLSLIILASFLSPIQEVISQRTVILWYIVSILLIFIGLIKTHIIIKKNDLKYFFLLFLILICYLNNNQNIKHGDLGYFMIGFTAICVMIFLPLQKEWNIFATKCVCVTSLIHIFATFFFFIFPSVWRKYSALIFGTYIPGTDNGAQGYTAALNGHYSTNGTLVAFGTLCAMTIYFYTNNKKEKKRMTLLILIGIVSVLLTQKRAHILFLAFTFIIIYIIANLKKGSIITMVKLLLLCFAAWIAIEIIVNYVPVLGKVFERFQTVGEDAQTLTRFTMWEYAINLFSDNKFLGIGWGGYRYQFSTLDMFEGAANAHNIYLQLLAETGIVGFIVFIIFAGINLYYGITMLIKINKNRLCFSRETQYLLLFSVIFQIFLLLYGFTGNILYDFCFIYYAIAVTISMNLKISLGR